MFYEVFFSEVVLDLYKSTIILHGIIMFGLVLLVATWICWISYRNQYVALEVLPMLTLLNPWINVEMKPAQLFSIGRYYLVDVNLN